MSKWKEIDPNSVTEWERGAVLTILSGHVGYKNAISRKRLLRSHLLSDASDRRLRMIIHQLRMDGELICSRGGIKGGYWMAENLDDVQSFLNTELRSRAYDMLKTAQRMEHSAIAQFGSQIQFI